MDNRRHRAPLSTLLIGGGTVVGVVLLGFAIHRVLVLPRDRAFDFFTIWFGIRRIWLGENPYSPEIARAIQRQVFGRTLPPGENQQGFAYPLYIAWVIGPFALPSFTLAVTAWCTSQFVGLMAFPLLAAKTFRWKPSREDLVIFLLAILLVFRYPTIAFVLGQTTIFVLLCLTMGLHWLDRQRDILAGGAFALTLIKPNLSVLAVVAILSWSALRRRWNILGGTLGVLTLLLGLSFAWQPTWIGDFVSGAHGYASYANVIWPFQQAKPVWIGGAILTAIVGLTARAILKAVRSNNRRDAALAFCFVIILSLVALPQTGSYSLTLLLIPALGFLALTPKDRWVRAGVFTSLVSPWLYWFLQAEWSVQIDQLALPLQFAVIGARILSLR